VGNLSSFILDGGHVATLEFVDLRKTFGSVQAVRGVSLSIADGEFLCLLGPSGCGKTTVLRIIAGFERPTAGSVLLDGYDITGVPPHRRSIGMVFQSYALFPLMTVEQNVQFGLRMHHIPEDEARRRIEEILGLLGLTRLRNRYPRHLSGGEQQRVAVGRVLVLRPKLLLFDEPLSNLDAKLRKETRHEIKRLQREVGTTTVYVTHDQEEAMAVADRLGVMRDGRLEQVGGPADVYDRPQTRFVADFIGASNLLSAVVRTRDGSRATLVTAAGLRVEVDARDDCTLPVEGSACTIGIRPEKLRMQLFDTKTAPWGRVESIVKLGATLEVRLVLSDGQPIVVHARDEEVMSLRIGVGTEVTLSWSPGAWSYFSE
jgi:ABC-type Fe3+/spermidine/putrescine transport system ATPase subunit